MREYNLTLMVLFFILAVWNGITAIANYSAADYKTAGFSMFVTLWCVAFGVLYTVLYVKEKRKREANLS